MPWKPLSNFLPSRSPTKKKIRGPTCGETSWWQLLTCFFSYLFLFMRQRQTGHKTSGNYAASALWLAVSTLDIMVVPSLVVTKKWNGNGNTLVLLGLASIGDSSCNLFWPLNHKSNYQCCYYAAAVPRLVQVTSQCNQTCRRGLSLHLVHMRYNLYAMHHVIYASSCVFITFVCVTF